MWQLHQFPLCPFSRKLRLLMGEKNVAYELVREYPWEGRDELWHLNPAGRDVDKWFRGLGGEGGAPSISAWRPREVIVASAHREAIGTLIITRYQQAAGHLLMNIIYYYCRNSIITTYVYR